MMDVEINERSSDEKAFSEPFDLDLEIASREMPGNPEFDNLSPSSSSTSLTNGMSAPKQYISPRCYGFGLRLDDLTVPLMPRCHITHTEQRKPDAGVDDEMIQSLLKWSLKPPNVVQFENLPLDFDRELFRDVVAHYGAILQSEVQRTNRQVLFRIKMNDAEACSWMVTNMNEMDVFGTACGTLTSHSYCEVYNSNQDKELCGYLDCDNNCIRCVHLKQ